ncbi:MAG: AAA family ATPase, partial [Ruminococcus sp.]|nr:AAA family ATPase [Ruminococcus sp.]
MNQYKPIPIGVEDFKEIIDKGSYYVDKTKMIQELLDNSAKVYLFTRPRRFGKTLNISMLQRFFEKTDEDNSYLFDGLNISKAG